MQTEKDTWTATGIDANMPTYRMLLILVGYIFVPRTSCTTPHADAVPRPQISSFRVLLTASLHASLALLTALFANYVIALRPALVYVPCFASLYLLLATTFFRSRIVIWMVRLYQARAPEEIRAKCVMTPRCSDYMVMAIEKYGLFVGVSKGVERLRRCGPPAQSDYP